MPSAGTVALVPVAQRATGRIELRFGTPAPAFVGDWQRELRRLGVRGAPAWQHELTCTDDGEGVDADVVDRRLGTLGVVPETSGQRGLFGRGLRDVWLAQGAGRIEGVRDGRVVESWFFPGPGDEPYAFVHVRDEPARRSDLEHLGVTRSGTRVTVPLTMRRLPVNGRLRSLVAQLVQLRPVLETRRARCGSSCPMSRLTASPSHAPSPTPSGPRCSTTRST